MDVCAIFNVLEQKSGAFKVSWITTPTVAFVNCAAWVLIMLKSKIPERYQDDNIFHQMHESSSENKSHFLVDRKGAQKGVL